MKTFLAAALAAPVALASAAQAGGPVIVEEEVEVVAEKSGSSVGILPILIGIAVLCAVVCNDDDDPRLSDDDDLPD